MRVKEVKGREMIDTELRGIQKSLTTNFYSGFPTSNM